MRFTRREIEKQLEKIGEKIQKSPRNGLEIGVEIQKSSASLMAGHRGSSSKLEIIGFISNRLPCIIEYEEAERQWIRPLPRCPLRREIEAQERARQDFLESYGNLEKFINEREGQGYAIVKQINMDNYGIMAEEEILALLALKEL